MSQHTISKLFEQKEEQINKEVEKLCNKAKKIAKTEMNLFRFELLFASSISKKKLDFITESIRDERDTVWNESLRRADGDFEKAMAIYENVAEEIV